MNWIRVSDRLPNIDDADEAGHVWVYDRVFADVSSVHFFQTHSPYYTHWMPKEKRPAPPDPPHPPEDMTMQTATPATPAELATVSAPVDVLPVIEHDGDRWRVVAKGTTRGDGYVYCHLASITRFVQQRNGLRPVQIADWIAPEVLA